MKYFTPSYENEYIGSGENKSLDDEFQMNCASRQTTTFLVFCLFPGLAALINLFVLAAVLRKARKLMRQSHVYAHVSSTLIGNVLFSVLALLQVLSLYFNFGGYPDDFDPTKRAMVHQNTSTWWPFHKAFLCGMFVIMCGNIGLLIDSIRHNTCSTLRTAAGHRFHRKIDGPKWKKRLLTRRQRSYLLIGLLWVIPLIYVAIPPAGWNCAHICQCLSQCFPSKHQYLPSDFTCSRIFPPMTNPWLSLVVVSWLCGVIVTIWMLKRSVRRVTKMWSRSFAVKKIEEKFVEEDNSAVEQVEKSFSVTTMGTSDPNPTDMPLPKSCSFSAVKKSDESNVTVAEINGSFGDKLGKDENVKTPEAKYFSVGKPSTGSLYSVQHQKFGNSLSGTLKNSLISGKNRRMREHLRNTKATTFSLRYVIYLTVSFVLFTAPTMVLLSIDILNPNLHLDMIILNSCLMCPFVYCYLCPFILVKCLPGVKTSLSALILSVYSTSD